MSVEKAKKTGPMRRLCEEVAGQAEVLQGNMAFAAGCVRAGIHAVDGYPGTPSTEVIDKGLAEVQDLLHVGWSVNEAVAAAVGAGHTYAGSDCVVTMKIPGLFQACDIFTSIAPYTAPRGALIFYVASDFTPSSTQHVIDPRYLYKSCFVPVFEPRNHQEMHEAARIAADIGRTYHTSVVIHASGLLCHSEGLIRLMERQTREPAKVAPLAALNSLPAITRKNYDTLMAERLPALMDMVERSPLNIHHKGAGKKGVITYGGTALLVEEHRGTHEPDLDVLSLGFSNPLPMKRIAEFCAAMDGPVYIVEDGYRFVQEACLAAGLEVRGKDVNSPLTEWTPEQLAVFLGAAPRKTCAGAVPVPRPPMICAGCPYRLTGEVLAKMRKRGELEGIFGDIGCNTLLFFMQALDTGLAMGASEGVRMGYVLSKPEAAGRCVSLLGDGTECHSGLDSTRNTIFRQIPGVKIVLDNEWIAMTGGQPGAASPCNLAGQPSRFNLVDALRGEGATVLTADAYSLSEIRARLKEALGMAKDGAFVVLVIRGVCLRKTTFKGRQTLHVDAERCKRCGACQICPGISTDRDGVPVWNNLCSGCGGGAPSCGELCPVKAISSAPAEKSGTGTQSLPEPPASFSLNLPAQRPERLALAIRGVGGQGNLFFGKVLAKMAFLAGYDQANVVKGETHGMAQMGGPVISTFACGKVHSPVLASESADCLIVMEQSEVLRPGFLDMLRPGGTVLLADTRLVPQGFKPEAYPSEEAIAALLAGHTVIRLNVLERAQALGDMQGRSANVVMLGALSKLSPFNVMGEAVWLEALRSLTPPAAWALNYAAFMAGRDTV